jgi:tetratricopeptide (TPR) repeat protein
MFADLCGFTSYSEDLPPEVVIGELNRYLAAMEPVLLTYRGHIDKYIGDGIMAEFGAPLDYETHRLQAVVAALKLQEKLSRSDFPWKMRVGIASGASIAGLIGSQRQSYTTIGDVVNLASRLEQTARPGEVLVDLATYDAIKHLVVGERRREWLGDSDEVAEKESELSELRNQLAERPNDAAMSFRMAELHQALGEMPEAVSLFERAVRLAPARTDYKVAYADAGILANTRGGIAVKGRSQRIEAYAITGFRDPLANRNAIPQAFYDDYAAVAGRIDISPDLVLPVEVLDGSVGHSLMVAVIAYAIADRMGLAEKERFETMQAGFLADIGKDMVPYLLNRTGGLRLDEFNVIREHPVESVRTLRRHGWKNPRILDIVRHSHERFNGGGYPDGLAGDRIPIGSRIVALADSYAALTSRRPYREAWDRKAALGEIASGARKGDYDPAVAEVLDRLMRN